jgi:hypothetical protein
VRNGGLLKSVTSIVRPFAQSLSNTPSVFEAELDTEVLSSLVLTMPNLSSIISLMDKGDYTCLSMNNRQ